MNKGVRGFDPELAEAVACVKPEFYHFEEAECWQLEQACPSCSRQTYYCIFSGILGVGTCTEEKYLHVCKLCRRHEFKSNWSEGPESSPSRSCPMCGHAYSESTIGEPPHVEGSRRAIEAGVLSGRIAHRAQQLYEARGRTPGLDLQDWLQAEREVLAEMGLTNR